MEQHLFNGDNKELLKTLKDNSVDSIVTDPPYGLSFMNKKWDYEVPSVEFWREVYRVLKPGGYILSFGGTRTYHRMVVNIEDAGFEIRDQIQWIYGQGFPKSHNIGKAVSKLQGNEREIIGKETTTFKVSNTKENNVINVGTFANNFSKQTDENGYRIKIITKGTSEWEGWGTALKPANEPICLARKPLSENTIAENVLKWGTGGLNIDGCRVGYISEDDKNNTINTKWTTNKDNKQSDDWGTKQIGNVSKEEGRFPANIILECICDEVIKGDKGDIHTNPMCPCYILDNQSGVSKSSKGLIKGGIGVSDIIGANKKEGGSLIESVRGHNDKGGASRFFYQAKASKKERNMGLDGFEDKERQAQNDTGLYSASPYCIDCGKTVNGTNNHSNCKEGLEYKPSSKTTKNNHPTVKPISLMAYLCRLITPPNGVVLDPYMGSGSTGIAAQLEGFTFIGMEMDSDYFKIAESRIKNYEKYSALSKK
jgi:DNA modification methylase